MAALSSELGSERSPPFRFNRTYVIAGLVLVFHAAALWALQAGLLQRAIEVIVPATMLTEFIEPPQPKIEPTPPEPQPQVPQPKKIQQPQAPMPVAVATAEPSPNTPVGAAAAPDVPLPPITAPVAVAAAPAAPPAPAKVELPSSDADYLHNPRPPYPALSKRLGEQGTVVVSILIGSDGVPQRADLKKTSGFDRLDQAALAVVMKWRYVPGKRAGQAETRWVDAPVIFALDK